MLNCNYGSSKIYLDCDKVLTQQEFNSETSNSKWQGSSLETWLNGKFYEESFNSYEKLMIEE